MKKHRIVLFALVLAIITGIAAWYHLSSSEEVVEGTLQITVSGKSRTVKLDTLSCEPVSGVRVNGKGETISVEGIGISLKNLLEAQKIEDYATVTVTSEDSYSAVLTAAEVQEDGRAYLLFQDEELRLVVFGDENSKRSVSNVVQLELA